MKTLTCGISPQGVARVEMLAELDATFAQLGAEPAIRAIVLSGKGNAFSAGADCRLRARFDAVQAFLNKRPAAWIRP